MKVLWNDPSRLLPGTVSDGSVLTLPPTGGGITLPEIGETDARYLNFTLTVLEEHSMAFEFRAYAAGEDEPRVTVRFGTMPRYRTNIPIDLAWLDGHILFPGHIPGELKVVCHGSRIEKKDVARAELISIPAFHETRVELEDVELSDSPRPASDVPDEIRIDAFGQNAIKDWPGKIRTEEELAQMLLQQASLPDEYPFQWTKWGGSMDQKMQDGTGFFRNYKKDGRWYLLDPDGCAFFSMGPDCVVIRNDGRVDGLEKLLTWEPTDSDLVEKMNRIFGEVPRGEGKMISFERANLKRAFGDGWNRVWQRMITSQLKNAGMNTLGNWSDPALYGRLPYVIMLPAFPTTNHTIFRDFPDVLSPEYRENAARCAEALADRKADPYMIGYFLRNEPGWAFVDNLVIADEVLRDPCDSYSKRGLVSHLKEKYGTVAALNAAWKSDFSDFSDLLRPIEKASALSECAEADLRAFSRELVRAYTTIPSAACRAVDPNHMNLGMRWAWISDPALTEGWESFDVFSINCYAVDPTPAIDRVGELGVDLPVMIGEFHFGALDAGPTATGLEAVPNQVERGAAYRYYTERVAAHPAGVGCHYFQCYDQFALGRFDGENYNIGLFDICLKPYKDMMDAVKACSEIIYRVKSGDQAPTDRKPDSIPMIAY